MSYFGPNQPLIRFAEGTIMSGTASANVTAQATSVCPVGTLLILVVYASVDPGNAVDAGEGWVLVESQFDSNNNYGLAIWATISRRHGTTRNGITLATAGDWASVVGIMWPGISSSAQQASFAIDLSRRCGSGNIYSATADARSMQWNPWLNGCGFGGIGTLGVELLAAGCYNGGTVPTATTPTGYLELCDQGVVAAPSFNVSCNFRNPTASTSQTNYTQSTVTASTYYTTSGAQTNRCAIRGWIPIVGLSNRRGRFLSSRRFMG